MAATARLAGWLRGAETGMEVDGGVEGEEMKKLSDAARALQGGRGRGERGACFSPRATFDANLSISLGGVKRHYPLLPLCLPPSLS